MTCLYTGAPRCQQEARGPRGPFHSSLALCCSSPRYGCSNTHLASQISCVVSSCLPPSFAASVAELIDFLQDPLVIPSSRRKHPFSPHHCVGFLLLGLLPPPTDRRPTDRPTDLLLAPSSLLLSPSSTHTWEPRGSFLLAGAALQALDGARARFGAPPLDATWEPRGSFLLAGAALQARFCWQGQHFRLWTVPERVSGPCQAQHLGASRLVSAGRGSTSGSGRCPSAFRGPPP